MRFYRNLLGDEGYLMHTLPVKALYEHVLAKLITSIRSGCWQAYAVCDTVGDSIGAIAKGFSGTMFGMLGQYA
jgi:hypothetical protein